jgi:hypothetical protein
MMGILGFKVALCLSYLRIISPAQRKYRLIVWGVLVYACLSNFALTLVIIFTCKPVSYSDSYYGKSTCGHRHQQMLIRFLGSKVMAPTHTWHLSR